MMYRLKLKFILTILCISVLFSCHDEDNGLGKNLVNSRFRTIKCDSSSISVSTIRIDSLETSGKHLILTGKYQHPLWGVITSSSYIPYKRPQYSTDELKEVILDSIMLDLTHSGYFIGDTTKVQKFSIHQLKERIRLNENGYIYSYHNVEYEPEALATHTYKPFPNTKEHKNIKVRLPDDLGQDLLTRFHNRDEAVSEERFEDYFKGIAIIPDQDISQSVVSFSVGDTVATIDLYYHIKGEMESGQKLRFIPKTSHQFNHYDYDRTGTSLESATGDIPSSQLGGKGILMGGMGWYSRLEFPYLNDLQLQGRIVNIQEAYLKIHAEPIIHSSFNALPDSIFLYVADENHVVTEIVKDYQGKQVQSGKLVKDDSFDGSTYYYFDITSFIQKELGVSGKYKHNLQLMLSANDYTNTFKNFTFRDQQGESPITLQLIYKIYESY